MFVACLAQADNVLRRSMSHMCACMRISTVIVDSFGCGVLSVEPAYSCMYSCNVGLGRALVQRSGLMLSRSRKLTGVSGGKNRTSITTMITRHFTILLTAATKYYKP